MNPNAPPPPLMPEDIPHVGFRAGLTTFGKVLLVLALGAGGAFGLKKMAKPPAVEETIRSIPSVQIATASLATATVSIASQGILEPATETRSVSEVTGKVIWISPKFNAGQEFSKDEEMLKLDPADYEAAATQAIARETEAAMNLKLEEARADQAVRDWNKLNPGQKPDSPLALREPQILAVRALKESATAAVAKANRDLERTVLKAPYACRIRRTHTDIGSFVAPGTPLADFYGTEVFEIRLPISVDEISLLPELTTGATAKLQATLGTQSESLTAKILRTEGEIDRQSRTLYLVVEFRPDATTPAALRNPGLFLHAAILGKTFSNIIRIPRLCLDGDSHVWIVDAQQKLSRRQVTVARKESAEVLISAGLNPGDRVLASNLPVLTEGMTVQVIVPKDPLDPKS